MKKIMNKKKVMIPIIFVLVLIVSTFSGCLLVDKPVRTLSAERTSFFTIIFWGKWAGQLIGGRCNATNRSFVLDTVSHENWEDYSIKYKPDDVFEDDYKFRKIIYWDELPPGKYYIRAVAYCYDFENFMKDYEEGYYQGGELNFKVPE